MNLIADSGSTKTDWLIQTTTASPTHITSSGINPCLMNDKQIIDILRSEVLPHITQHPSRIFFYGAGCRPDQQGRMATLLTTILSAHETHVNSDLMGAAHALCGNSPGIVAILGTGSGSAVYDGSRFTTTIPSLGYILGDEGSGAVLGRRLLGDIFKNQLSAHLTAAFRDAYPTLTLSSTIEQVYRGNTPNRYLAQFSHFLSAHRHEEEIRRMLINEFRTFFSRNIRPYDRTDLSVNFVGSIATVFEEELRAAADAEGYKIGDVLRSPIERLASFCSLHSV